LFLSPMGDRNWTLYCRTRICRAEAARTGEATRAMPAAGSATFANRRTILTVGESCLVLPSFELGRRRTDCGVYEIGRFDPFGRLLPVLPTQAHFLTPELQHGSATWAGAALLSQQTAR